MIRTVNILAAVTLCVLLIRCNNPDKKPKESTQKVLVIENDSIVNKLFLSEKNFDLVLSDLQEADRSQEIRANKHNPNQNDTVVSLYQSNDFVVYVRAYGKQILKDLNLSNPNAGFNKMKIGMSKESFSKKIGNQNVPDTVLISGQEGLNDFKVIFSNDTLVEISYDLEYLD